MNAIFGIYYRDAQPVMQTTLERMQFAMAKWGVSGCNLWLGDGIGIGSTSVTREFDFSVAQKIQLSIVDGLVFAAAGRLDNRREMRGLLDISEVELCSLTDLDVMRRAYLKWGKDCSKLLFGDWSFVAWHPKERHLILSRDHYGNTPLYYFHDNNVFAFSTYRQGLLSLGFIPVQLDELSLAQYLTSWMPCRGDRTLHYPIRRLPPAHYLVANNNSYTTHQYWRLEDVKELKLNNRNDYLDAFKPIFEESVKCRLRSDRPVACTLSGGLDSSSIAVIAASILKKDSGRLTTLTSVPLFDSSSYVKSRFADEYPFAKATAQYAGNIDLQSFNSAEGNPISAIRCFLQHNLDPCHAACNVYWIRDMLQIANNMGCRVLLTGGMGNASFSWQGDIYSQPWLYILKQIVKNKLARYEFQQSIRNKIKRFVPVELLASIQRYKKTQQKRLKRTAIHPDFALRLNLFERMEHDTTNHQPLTPIAQRNSILMPGSSFLGSYVAEMAAAYGMEIRDPAGDARVLSFVFSVPDNIFIDPLTGMDRWLIREAMRGRLPDEVRLNRSRGRQAGDLVPRLRACGSEVEAALNELSHGPSAEYVDVPYMRQVWQLIQTDDSVETFNKSIIILTRGIMAGLFVNQFYE